MYVLINAINQEGVIESLQRLAGDDCPLTTETIADVIEKVLIHQPAELIADQFEQLVNYFLYELSLEGSDQIDDDLLECIHESVYAELNQSKRRFSRLTGILVKQFGFSQENGIWLLNGDPKDINQFILTAREAADKLSEKIEDPDERLIYRSLIGQLTELELIADYKFKVMRKPGKAVAYGNDLITFPVILAEVFK